MRAGAGSPHVGELQNGAAHVVVTTDAGEVVVDGERATFPNDFLRLWLPPRRSRTNEVT